MDISLSPVGDIQMVTDRWGLKVILLGTWEYFMYYRIKYDDEQSYSDWLQVTGTSGSDTWSVYLTKSGVIEFQNSDLGRNVLMSEIVSFHYVVEGFIAVVLESNKDVVAVGSEFNLPDKAMAYFDGGLVRQEDIVWNNPVDTSMIGTYNFIGSVAGFDDTVGFELMVGYPQGVDIPVQFILWVNELKPPVFVSPLEVGQVAEVLDSVGLELVNPNSSGDIYYSYKGNPIIGDVDTFKYVGSQVVDISRTVYTVVKNGNSLSSVVSAGVLVRLSSPNIDLPSGHYSDGTVVNITNNSPGSVLYYTIDGVTTPSMGVGFICDGTVSIYGVVKLKVVAVRDGTLGSDVVEANYNLPKCDTPDTSLVQFPNKSYFGSVLLDLFSDYPVGSEIYYNVDSLDMPNKGSIKYSSPVLLELNSITEIKAIAYAEEFEDSDIAVIKIWGWDVQEQSPVLFDNVKSSLLSKVSSNIYKRSIDVLFSAFGSISYSLNGTASRVLGTQVSNGFVGKFEDLGYFNISCMAYSNSKADSEVVNYEFRQQLDDVVFSVPDVDGNGDVVVYKDSLLLGLSERVDGSTIYYTLDGSNPTTSSNVYSGLILIEQPTTVKAIAVKENYVNSDIVNVWYYVEPVLEVPEIVVGEKYYSGEVSFSFTHPDIENVSIFYNIGNNPLDPYAGWGEGLVGGPFTYTGGIVTMSGFVGDIVIKAIAANMVISSDVVSKNVIEGEVLQVNAPFVVNGKSGGLYYNDIEVELACDTEGAEIRYTVDGSDPTDVSSLYSGPIPMGVDNTVLKAQAFKVGENPSQQLINTYRFKCVNPVILPVNYNFFDSASLEMSSLTDGYTIYYTKDGSEPNVDNKANYFTSNYRPVDVLSVSTVVKAVATKLNYQDSSVVTKNFTKLSVLDGFAAYDFVCGYGFCGNFLDYQSDNGFVSGNGFSFVDTVNNSGERFNYLKVSNNNVVLKNFTLNPDFTMYVNFKIDSLVNGTVLLRGESAGSEGIWGSSFGDNDSILVTIESGLLKLYYRNNSSDDVGNRRTFYSNRTLLDGDDVLVVFTKYSDSNTGALTDTYCSVFVNGEELFVVSSNDVPPSMLLNANDSIQLITPSTLSFNSVGFYCLLNDTEELLSSGGKGKELHQYITDQLLYLLVLNTVVLPSKLSTYSQLTFDSYTQGSDVTVGVVGGVKYGYFNNRLHVVCDDLQELTVKDSGNNTVTASDLLNYALFIKDDLGFFRLVGMFTRSIVLDDFVVGDSLDIKVVIVHRQNLKYYKVCNINLPKNPEFTKVFLTTKNGNIYTNWFSSDYRRDVFISVRGIQKPYKIVHRAELVPAVDALSGNFSIPGLVVGESLKIEFALTDNIFKIENWS